jgi:hypothetical protein
MAITSPDGSEAGWWQTLTTGSAELPFRAYFDELQALPQWREEPQMPSPVDLELLLRARVATPVEGWQSYLERTTRQAYLERMTPRLARPRSRAVPPPIPKEYLEELAQREWGGDAEMIEGWFDEGDTQQCETDRLVEEPEIDGLDRALGWVRSLAVATKLIPA